MPPGEQKWTTFYYTGPTKLVCKQLASLGSSNNNQSGNESAAAIVNMSFPMKFELLL